MSMDKDFALALIGGLLVLMTGVVEFLYSVSMIFWNLSYVGILFGFFMIIGAFLMKYMPRGINSKAVGIEKTSRFPLGGFICLICSLVSLTFLQGFLIGPMLGIVASTSSYSRIYKNK